MLPIALDHTRNPVYFTMGWEVFLYGAHIRSQCPYHPPTHPPTHTHTYTHTFNGPFYGTTQVSWYQKGKTNLDFTEARDSERQWHQVEHMEVCNSLQTDNHANIPPLSFSQAGCPSCRPTNSVKALKEQCPYQSMEIRPPPN